LPSLPPTLLTLATHNLLTRERTSGAYDFATIHALINTCPLLHVSFTDPDQPFPVVLPMLGCMGNYADKDADDTGSQDVYMHGYISGRVFRSCNDGQLPVTVAASFLDGLVLALTPFHNSCNYRSAVVFGHASLVDDADEARWALKRITEGMLPGRWDASRGEPTAAELASTGVLRVRVQSASAKVRTGGPSEDRADLKNEALVKRTWTGVVPYWGTWGEPVEGRENGCAEVEPYIEQWRQKETGKARAYAFEAIGLDDAKK
jgi:nitroimidazol reductase NimA-like FMN-containing flavoprotein (pyridoxamine 5'-phosphate oxidase superfamily)